MTRAPRLLLVSPAFHGYWASVQRAFQARGYEVRTHCYDQLTGPLAKLRHKVGTELPQRALGRSVGDDRARTRATVEALTRWRPDRVLVLKGDTLGDDFWQAVDELEAAAIVWLYDELERTAYSPESLVERAPIASYSPVDVAALRAAGARAAHVPLAFDPELADRSPGLTTPETVFVGARYPSRAALLGALHAQGIPVRAYGRDWSGHPIDRLRTWRLHGARVPAGRDLARPEAYAVMAAARAALNLHGRQDGFTMRTFEAAGAGAVQLIDRADVADLYDPDTEIAVFDGADEAAGLIARAARDHRWAADLRAAARARTLAQHTFAHRAIALESLWD